MKSFWREKIENYKEFECVQKDEKATVCIIGGGLAGLSTAYYLSKHCSVILVEKNRICSSTSGANTGKITSQHGLFYKYLEDSQGRKFAKKYIEANEEAINNIENIINKEKISCDFEREDSYVFTQKETELYKLENEQKAVDKICKGLSEVTKSVDLPLEIAGALKFRNQAKFNPVKYAYGLASTVEKNHGKIYENSHVTDIKEEDGKHAVYVNNHKIVADYVVVTTRYPFLKVPGYYFLKMYQSTSYAIVADCKRKLFSGMYISQETPTISFRTIKDGTRDLLLAVGYDYKTGTEELINGYARLETVVRKMYPEAEVLYKWTAEDCITLDKFPYVGNLSNMMSNVYVATGFNKWGITSSNVAANIITDEITKKENEYAQIFKSTRMEPIKNRQEVGNMLKETGKSIILSRFKVPKKELDDINPTCPHLGCKLHFNNIEKIWECPCHGSKFTLDGKCIEGPSNTDLK